MIDKDRGLKLLGSGMAPTDVATALGCDPSLISQWLVDDAFRANVLALRMESLQAATERDKKIDQIEDELIKKLAENIPYLVKTKDILAAFDILNRAKRRGAQTSGGLTINAQTVSIVMPPAARQFYFPKTNAQGEVVAVGDRDATTMPLQNLVAARLKNNKKEAEDAVIIAQENKDGTTKASDSGPVAGKERREEAAAA